MSSGAARGPPTALIVEIKQCRDLHDTQLIGKMNPYVEVTLGSKKKKTDIHSKGGRFPSWDEKLTFTYADESSINFKVLDKDMIGSDYVGCHDFLLQPVVANAKREFSGQLQLTRAKGRAAGYIDVSLTFVGEVGSELCDLGHAAAVETRRQETEGTPSPRPAAAAVAPVAPYQAAAPAAPAAPAPQVAAPQQPTTVVVNQAPPAPEVHQHFAAPQIYAAPQVVAPAYPYPAVNQQVPYGYPQPTAPYPYAPQGPAPYGYAPYGAPPQPPAAPYGYYPHGGYRQY